MGGPTPPGVTSHVRATSALVVAPHYDDEVLGCGGLVAQLVDRGRRGARALSLRWRRRASRRSGTASLPARRRAESAAAAECLGLAGVERLGLPDGALDGHLEEIAAALRHALLALRPALLLLPSPLEATPDHRAAFAAAFELLASVRPGDPLAVAADELQVLLYEVNHPGYPNLLVDVSAELPRLEAAMACYPSQQERHDYLAAAVGLRRYRALSLPPGVTAAEGYVQLALEDFTTRSRARLVPRPRRRPAAARGARGADDHARRAHLRAAGAARRGAGERRGEQLPARGRGGGQRRRPAPELPADFPLPIRRVDLPQRQGRAEAANAGVAAATGAFVAFLDDDDLIEPEHLATLAGLVSAPGVRIAYTDAAVASTRSAPPAGSRPSAASPTAATSTPSYCWSTTTSRFTHCASNVRYSRRPTPSTPSCRSSRTGSC